MMARQCFCTVGIAMNLPEDTQLLKDLRAAAYRGLPVHPSAGKNWNKQYGLALANLLLGRIEPSSEMPAAKFRNYLADQIRRKSQGQRTLYQRIEQARSAKGGSHVVRKETQTPGAHEVDNALMRRCKYPHTIISDDKDLFQDLLFIGVTPKDTNYAQHVLIDAWFDGSIFYLSGYAIADGLMGIAHFEFDLDKRTIRKVGEIGAGPVTKETRLGSRLYSSVAQAIDGPIKSDDTVPAILQSENKTEVFNADNRTLTYTSIETFAVTEKDKPPSNCQPNPVEEDWETFGTWDNLTEEMDRVPLHAECATVLRTVFVKNPNTKAVFEAVQIMLSEPDGASPIRRDIFERRIEQRIAQLKLSEKMRRRIEKSTQNLSEDFDPVLTNKAADDIVAHKIDTIANMFREEEQDASYAILRYIADMAPAAKAGKLAITCLQKPVIPDQPQFKNTDESLRAIAVVRDRALFEILEDGYYPARKVRREMPIVILYRIVDGCVGILAIQMDGQDYNLVDACDFPLTDENDRDFDEDSDLTWYLRGLLSHLNVVPTLDSSPSDKSEPVSGRTSEADPGIEDKVDEKPSPSVEKRPSNTANHAAPRIQTVPQLAAFRTVCQARVDVEDMGIAIDVIDRWFEDRARQLGERVTNDQRDHKRGWRLEHTGSLDSEDLWAVNVRGDQSSPMTLEISVETDFVGRVRPRLPTILRELASETVIQNSDGIIHPRAKVIATSAAMTDFVRLATDPERIFPILIMSSDENAVFINDPDIVAAQCAGAMHVFTIMPSRTYDLSDRWGRNLSAYNGSIRIYQPRFDPENDSPFRHQLIMPGANARDKLSSAIDREMSETLWRYGINVADELQDTLDSIEEDKPATGIPAARPQKPAPEESDHKTPKVSQEPQQKPEALDPVTSSSSEAPTSSDQKMVPAAEISQPIQPLQEISEALPNDAAPTLPISEPESDADIEGHPEKGKPESSEQPEPHSIAQNEPVEPATAPMGLGIDKLVEHEVKTALRPILGRLDDIEEMLTAANSDRVARERKSETVKTVAIDRVQGMQETIVRERRESAEIIRIAEEEKLEALSEAAQLRAALRAALSAQERAPGAQPPKMTFPETLSDLEPWAERHLVGRVHIMPRAYRVMRKTVYTDVERACRALLLLAGPYLDAKHGIDGSYQQFQDGLNELRLIDKPQASTGGATVDAEYYVSYHGERLFLDKHLRGKESRYNNEKMLRIYYHYHEATDQVLIGHMPSHLTTMAS